MVDDPHDYGDPLPASWTIVNGYELSTVLTVTDDSYSQHVTDPDGYEHYILSLYNNGHVTRSNLYDYLY